MTQSKRKVINNISDEEWLTHFERLFESTITDEILSYKTTSFMKTLMT
jgi:hypothetical protein